MTGEVPAEVLGAVRDPHLRQPAARLRRLALGGHGRRGARRRRGHRRRGRAAARRRRRCWRRRGCRGTSGCAPATSPSATCCPPPRTTRGWCRPTPPTTTPPTTPRAASSPSSWAWAASGSCRAEGRAEAVARWADGEFGPASAMARSAPGPCVTCGFLLPLAGSLRQRVGACGNAYAPGRRPRRHRRLRLRCAQPGDAGGGRHLRGRPHRALRHRHVRRPERLVLPARSWPCQRMTPRPRTPRPMAATQVQVHIRSTRSPSSRRTTRATAHSADPGEHHPRGVHLQRGRGLLRRRARAT